MVRLVEDIFGTAINPLTKQSEQIRRFTLSNDNHMQVQIISLGATVSSIKVPDQCGAIEDIVLGYDDIAGYQMVDNPYFGATVGRVCNRVANATFTLGGHKYDITKNLKDKHHLHGGFVGFNKVHWTVLSATAAAICMQHRSVDGHEGYPGDLTATVHFALGNDNSLHIRMQAASTEMTPVNLTNHTYFNLAGHSAGKDALYEHCVTIKANCITETDSESIPTGRLLPVQGTPFDLRSPTVLRQRLHVGGPLEARGYDDNFIVKSENNENNTKCSTATNTTATITNTTNIARVNHRPTGRWLEIATNQPGVQFYTSDHMPDPEQSQSPIIGKSGAKYTKRAAFCLETQKYPDSVNHDNFPSIILQPGEEYFHEVIYKFGVDKKDNSK